MGNNSGIQHLNRQWHINCLDTNDSKQCHCSTHLQIWSVCMQLFRSGYRVLYCLVPMWQCRESFAEMLHNIMCGVYDEFLGLPYLDATTWWIRFCSNIFRGINIKRYYNNNYKILTTIINLNTLVTFKIYKKVKILGEGTPKI